MQAIKHNTIQDKYQIPTHFGTAVLYSTMQHANCSVMDLHAFVLVDSLRMAPRCRSMLQFHNCYNLCFIVFY
jgi:hypothetical protein